jgi:sucrose phosphorylase
VAYLWKQVGTCCIHLPQTHAVVKFFRELLDLVAPHVVLLTETNVPHEENVSYFGAGDEAQMVYQFSLPPLLLDALLTGDAQPLVGWLTRLKPAPAGATFFNFTASHDGIGVRPLEGLISAERFAGLIEAIRARGGLVSTRRMADGRDHPYELNITYFDALGEPSGGDSELHVRRFLASQAVMLALRGIPGVYLLSLLGASNDVAGVRETGQARRINRHKYERSELAQMLADPARPPRRVFEGYRRLLAVRTRQPAFHPDADQSVWNTGLPWLVALVRTSLDGHQRILVLANVSRERQTLTLTDEWESGASRDLLSGRVLPHGSAVELAPYEVLWLTDA